MKAMLAGLATLGLAAGVEAQVFKTGTELVTVPLTVTQRQADGPMPQLTAADFRIFEDGIEQAVTLFDHHPRAISLCLLLDSSPSMEPDRRLMARVAIESALAELTPDDEVALVTFAQGSHLALPWTRGDRVPPIRWDDWRASPGTALIDAMRQAIGYLDEASNPLRVVLIVSDGGENMSRTTLAHLASTRRQSETLVYAIQTRADVVGFPGVRVPGTVEQETPTAQVRPILPAVERDFSPQIVGDSGGRVFHVQHPTAATNAARILLSELRALFTIGFVPTKISDGRYRRLRIETRVRGIQVRHRGGYLATPLKAP
jgi:Ca-activated chloride channel family protein